MQSVIGRQVDNVEDVSAEQRLTSGESKPKGAHAGEGPKQIVKLLDCQRLLSPRQCAGEAMCTRQIARRDNFEMDRQRANQVIFRWSDANADPTNRPSSVKNPKR